MLSLLLSCSPRSDMTCGTARSILPGRASQEVRSSRNNVASSARMATEPRGHSCDCQHQGSRELGWCGRVNPGEALLNVVIKAKRKMLIRLDQKVRGQVRRLRTPPAQLL